MIIEQGTSEMPTDRRPVVTAGRVHPVRYKNARLRHAVGDYIGRTDSDGLMAATLWAAEAFACRYAIDDLATHGQVLAGAVERYERSFPDEFRHSVRREAESLASQLLADMRCHLGVVKTAEIKAREAFKRLHQDFGSDPVDLFKGARSRSEADTIFSLLDEAERARAHAEDDVEIFNAKIKILKELAVRREAFAETEASASIKYLANLDGGGLERLIAWLLKRDGLEVLRAAGGPGDQGVDVLGRMSTGEVVAIQSKFRQRGPVNPRVVYELNGAARDLHGASYAVVVTNSTFSEQATRDAATLGVLLVDGYALEAWATWGDTLFDVAGIPTAPAITAPRSVA